MTTGGARGGKHLSEPFDIVVALSGAGLMLVTFAVASLYGFVFGWRTANALWEGARFQTLLANDPVFRRLAEYRMPLLLGFILIGSASGVQGLRWWLNSGITVEDVIGTYRVKNVLTHAMLEVSADRTWQYWFVGPPEFHRSGIWALEPGYTTPTEVVITLHHFEIGYPGYYQGPVIFMSTFSRTVSGTFYGALIPAAEDYVSSGCPSLDDCSWHRAADVVPCSISVRNRGVTGPAAFRRRWASTPGADG